MSLDVTETKATCQNCLRSRDRRFSYVYRSDLKCCTFHPFLPNYAVGGLLQEASASSVAQSSGVNELINKIQQREFAFPIGVMAPYDYQFKFLSKEEHDFGNREDLLCPYYDVQQNQCSIWNFRGVVCTSYYCRSQYGQDGQKFWAVFSDYLSYVEMALAEECLVQLDFSPRQISEQLNYLNKREFSSNEIEQKQILPDVDRQIWNNYDEDKINFYKKCFLTIQKLDRLKFKEIIGSQGLELEKEVLDYAHRR